MLDYVGEFSRTLSKLDKFLTRQEDHESQLNVLSWDKFSVLTLALSFREALIILYAYGFSPRRGINTS